MIRSAGTARLSAIATLVAVVALLLPSSSPAVVDSGCGSVYAGDSATCSLHLVGAGLEVSGTAPAWISVNVLDPLGNNVGGCYGYQYCSSSFRLTAVPTFATAPAGGLFTCHVEGVGGGMYGCNSTAF